jgi:hypothetical protein
LNPSQVVPDHVLNGRMFREKASALAEALGWMKPIEDSRVLLEYSLAGEERGAIRAFRDREELCPLIVNQDPTAIAGHNRSDTAKTSYCVSGRDRSDRAIDFQPHAVGLRGDDFDRPRPGRPFDHRCRN